MRSVEVAAVAGLLGMISVLHSACVIEGKAECVGDVPTAEACMEGVRVEQLDNWNSRVVFGPPDEGGEPFAQTRQPLVTDPHFHWENPKIPVCWDEETYREEDQWKRDLVRRAVRETWERAFDRPFIPVEKRIEFLDWGICGPDEKGIRVIVRDEVPESHVGADHVRVSHAYTRLNFEFRNWSEDVCRRDRKSMEHCIYSVAVHEFGHAIGLFHEHNRDDTPKECLDSLTDENREDATGWYGLTYYGQWDECSVENYCAPAWNNNGRLSMQDVLWLQLAYLPELAGNPDWCRQLDFISTLGVDPREAARRDSNGARSRLAGLLRIPFRAAASPFPARQVRREAASEKAEKK